MTAHRDEPIGLSDGQLAIVRDEATLVPHAYRRAFLASVEDILVADYAPPHDDDAVATAARAARLRLSGR